MVEDHKAENNNSGKIKNLEVTDNIKEDKEYSVVKEMPKSIVEGSTKGIEVAKKVNKTLPGLGQAIASIIGGASITEGLGLALGLATNPVATITGLGVIAIGAGIGALVGVNAALKRNKQFKLATAEEKVR